MAANFGSLPFYSLTQLSIWRGKVLGKLEGCLSKTAITVAIIYPSAKFIGLWLPKLTRSSQKFEICPTTNVTGLTLDPNFSFFLIILMILNNSVWAFCLLLMIMIAVYCDWYAWMNCITLGISMGKNEITPF